MPFQNPFKTKLFFFFLAGVFLQCQRDAIAIVAFNFVALKNPRVFVIACDLRSSCGFGLKSANWVEINSGIMT